MKKVEISLGQNSYEVVIGSGLLEKLSELLPESLNGRKLALLADETVAGIYADSLNKQLANTAKKTVSATFPNGEANKTFETVNSFYRPLIENHFERKDALLALGGGVAGDIVGFVAATYLRGVPFVQLPTSLLAMVDASVGGKVACNHPLGKNLIGAFHQPALVVADISTLKTLPKRELTSGFAECIKHGVIGDPALFSWTKENAEKLTSGDEATLAELVAKNVAFKAKIVSQDEKEHGVRALLNLGHTFGHAIEKVAGYGEFTHGEAVALGMCAAMWLSIELGFSTEESLKELSASVQAFGLPQKAKLPEAKLLIEAMRSDKKVQNEKIRLVLCRGIGDAFVFEDATEENLLDAFSYISE